MFVAALSARPGDKILLAGFGSTTPCSRSRTRWRIIAAVRALALAREAGGIDELYEVHSSDIVTAWGSRRGQSNSSLNILWRNRKAHRPCRQPLQNAERPNTPLHRSANLTATPSARWKTTRSPVRKGRSLCIPAICWPFGRSAGDLRIVNIEGGGRLLADFTDCTLDDIKVGLPVQMSPEV